MAVIYVDVPSLIENATMKKGVLDGVHKTYRITPVSGYVIHDKNRDMPEYDPVTMMPTGNILAGFTTGTVSCTANYDFVTNPREFYTALASEIPENQINGINEPKPEPEMKNIPVISS